MTSQKQRDAARRNIKKAQAALRGDIKRGEKMTKRGTSRRSYVKRRAPDRKIGILPVISEVGGTAIGVSQALSGNVGAGVAYTAGGFLLSKALKWAARRSELHKLGVKIGKKRELVIA